MTWRDGGVAGPAGKKFNFKELAEQINKTGEPIVGKGFAPLDVLTA